MPSPTDSTRPTSATSASVPKLAICSLRRAEISAARISIRQPPSWPARAAAAWSASDASIIREPTRTTSPPSRSGSTAVASVTVWPTAALSCSLTAATCSSESATAEISSALTSPLCSRQHREVGRDDLRQREQPPLAARAGRGTAGSARRSRRARRAPSIARPWSSRESTGLRISRRRSALSSSREREGRRDRAATASSASGPAPARTRPRRSGPPSPTRWLKMQAIRRFPGLAPSRHVPRGRPKPAPLQRSAARITQAPRACKTPRRARDFAARRASALARHPRAGADAADCRRGLAVVRSSGA